MDHEIRKPKIPLFQEFSHKTNPNKSHKLTYQKLIISFRLVSHVGHILRAEKARVSIYFTVLTAVLCTFYDPSTTFQISQF